MDPPFQKGNLGSVLFVEEDVNAACTRKHRPELGERNDPARAIAPPSIHTSNDAPTLPVLTATTPGAPKIPLPMMNPTTSAVDAPLPSWRVSPPASGCSSASAPVSLTEFARHMLKLASALPRTLHRVRLRRASCPAHNPEPGAEAV